MSTPTSIAIRYCPAPATLLLLLAILCFSPSGWAAADQLKPLMVDGDPNTTLQLLPHSVFLHDREQNQHPETLFQPHGEQLAFQTLSGSNFTADAGVYWFRFQLKNNADTPLHYWLNLEAQVLQQVALYKRDTQAPPQKTGFLYINPEWNVQEQVNVLPVHLAPRETADYLLRVQHNGMVRFEPQLLSNHSFITRLSGINLRLGLSYGILFALFIFALNLYFSLRNKIFLFYLLYIVALTIQTATTQGSIKLLFPGDEFLAASATRIGAICNLLAGAFFTRYFLQLEEKHARLDKMVLATGLVPTIIVIAIPMTPAMFEVVILTAGAISLIVNCGASLFRLSQHFPPAGFILAGNLIVLLPLVLVHSFPQALLPINTYYNLLFNAAIFKAVILGCGLSALVDSVNKSLSREVSERQSRESQLMHAQHIARYGDWSWDTSNNAFHFSESALDILPSLAAGEGNHFEKLLKRATTRQKRKMRIAFSNAVKEKQGFDTEFSLLHDDGSTHYYLTRAEFQRDKHGQVTSTLIGTIHDITDSKLADLAYRENEQRWRELADSTFESILIYHDDVIIDANQACEQLLGFSPTELIGSSGEEFVSSDQLATLLGSIREASNKPIEMSLTHRNGDTIDIEFRSRGGVFNQQSVQIVAIRDISERKLHEEQLVKLGYYDNLTGLANRTLFQERLQHAINKSQRYSQTHALLFIDLDQFKHVNDSLGHDVGDKLLVEVGRRLKARVRREDTVARFGGDEFAVLVEDIAAPYAAAKVADEIIKVMSDPVEVDGYQLMVTPSIGIAIYPSDGNSGGELLRKADTAMYHAKGQGRNNYQFYTEELNERMVRRMDLESELRLAVNNKAFNLHFQPKVDLTSGNIVGAEALLRWHSPRFGQVAPDEFIGIAEETGLIWQIGELALEQACLQAESWRKMYPAFTSVAVNISGIQFNHINLVDSVAEVVRKTGLPPEYLELEITEGAIIDNAEEAIAVMMQLKSLGVKLSLDDFGTGYSSLNYLKRFPVDSLKIDRSFIAEIVDDSTGKLIADNIIRLAHALKLKIVAEGVETAEQLNMIREMGCDELQGYIFSRPLPHDELEKLLTDSRNLYHDKPVANNQ